VVRFENGALPHAAIEDVGAWSAVVGLDLVFRTYPGGDPIRDAGQQRLLERLRTRIDPALIWRTEVPLPVESDRRAWDAVIRADEGWVAVEAETVLSDLQALERRVRLKGRDGGCDHVILLVADTPRNRRALRGAPAAFGGFSSSVTAIRRGLRVGRVPRTREIILH
jgi:hypothetical protein